MHPLFLSSMREKRMHYTKNLFFHNGKTGFCMFIYSTGEESIVRAIAARSN